MMVDVDGEREDNAAAVNTHLPYIEPGWPHFPIGDRSSGWEIRLEL